MSSGIAVASPQFLKSTLASSAITSNSNQVILGDSEDYYTCLTTQSTVLGNPCPTDTTSSIDAAWTDLITNITTSPTNMVYMYSWNTFQVNFAFQNLNTSDSQIHYLNLNLLDSVIATIHNAGFNVVIGDIDFSNFGSAAWVQDWLQLTQHYKGDSEVQAFDLFEEPDPLTWSSNVTTTIPSSSESVESAYYNVTKAIRSIDPTRTVIWYLPELQYTLNPAYTMSNVVYDFHLYANGPDYGSFRTISLAYNFAKEYDVTVGCFELNVESRGGVNFNQTEAEISYMKELGIGYLIWDYSDYYQYSLSILQNPYEGQWLSTSSYPLDVSEQSCLTSGPATSVFMYCIGGVGSNETDYSNSFYASLNSGIYEYGATDPWTSTTSYPLSVAGLSCAIYNSTSYCVGGNSAGKTISNVYSASLSSTGIETWQSETSYPTNIQDTSCFTSSIGSEWADLYCVGGENSGGSATSATYYASLVSGTLSWNVGSAYPEADEGVACATVYVNPWYVYCVGGENSTDYSSSVFYAEPTENGLGTWHSTTSYPVPIADPSCSIWNATIFCSGGTTTGGSYSNSVYYAAIGSTGVGTWRQTTNYPSSITENVCQADYFWLYCLGGNTGGSSSSNAYDLFLGFKPPAGPLGLQLGAISASVGTSISWNSTGWYPEESVTIMAFNPSTTQYIILATSNANSAGTVNSNFVISAALAGALPDKVFAEDRGTPFPHYGFRTNIVNLTVTQLPPVGPLLLNLSSTSGSVGANISWTSTGWNPTETVTILEYNPTTEQYSTLGQSTTNSSGIATGSFVVPAKMVGTLPDQIYCEDASTPFPHTGYQTGIVSFSVTASG